MDEVQTERLLVKCLSAALVLLGAITLGSIWWSASSSEAQKKKAPQRSLSYIELKDQPQKTSAPHGKMIHVKLPCFEDHKQSSWETSAKHIRLVSKLCRSSDDQLVKATVLNQSTGVQATVFQTSGSEFTSDFIDLADGPNKIHMTTQLRSGEKRVRDITVVKLIIPGETNKN